METHLPRVRGWINPKSSTLQGTPCLAGSWGSSLGHSGTLQFSLPQFICSALFALDFSHPGFGRCWAGRWSWPQHTGVVRAMLNTSGNYGCWLKRKLNTLAFIRSALLGCMQLCTRANEGWILGSDRFFQGVVFVVFGLITNIYKRAIWEGFSCMLPCLLSQLHCKVGSQLK